MERLLIIPNINDIERSLELAHKYNLGFEYNDFFDPDVLDDESRIEELIKCYKKYDLPEFSTLHGAFYDVIPFSKDKKVKEISTLRIKQSIEVARKLSAFAVIFHTNYNPFLNTTGYMNLWIEENVRFWSEILEENKDINIYLENMFDSSPDMLKGLSKKLCMYENYGVCLDYAHASISKVAPKEWISSLDRYIKHIHINDNDLISDLHLPWGDGKVDREVFYENYKEYMNNATVLVENSDIEMQVKSLRKLKEDGFITIK